MISLFSLLLTGIIIGSIIIALTLFGDSPNVRNTWINKLHQYILQQFRRINLLYEFIDKAYFNNKLFNYLAWAVPLFYFVTITYCLHNFFTKTYYILPIAIQQSYVHKFCIGISVIMIYTTFFQCVFSNPGRVDNSNVIIARTIFENNNLIFFDDNSCSTCQIIKPARSKHCSLCNSCVLLFDHHCVWVNNCVGYYNYRWFLAYLFCNIEIFIYGFYLCLTALRANRDSSLSYWRNITSTTDTNKITGIFIILCIIFCFLTSVFTGLHLRYIYLGVTTNEAEKWSEIEYLISIGVLYESQYPQVPLERYLEKAIVNENGAYNSVYISLKTERIVFEDQDSNSHSLRKINSIETEIDNIYDRGFWNNLKERLFPIYNH